MLLVPPPPTPTPLWSGNDRTRRLWQTTWRHFNEYRGKIPLVDITKMFKTAKNDEHEQYFAVVLTCWSSSVAVLTFCLSQLTLFINCSFPHLVLSRISVCHHAKRDIDIPFLSVRPSVRPTRCTVVSKLLCLSSNVLTVWRGHTRSFWRPSLLQNSKANPLACALNARRGNNCEFRPMLPFMSETVRTLKDKTWRVNYFRESQLYFRRLT